MGWLLVLPLFCTQRREEPFDAVQAKISLSVPKQGAECQRVEARAWALRG